MKSIKNDQGVMIVFHEWDSSGEGQIFQKAPATYTRMTLQWVEFQNQTICLFAVQEDE